MLPGHNTPTMNQPKAVAKSVRVLALRAEGRELESEPSQTNGLPNLFLSPPDLPLGITIIGQELVSSISG